MTTTIQANSTIRWRYRLLLADGTVFEENMEPEGELLQLGQDQIHPNLESLLPGLTVGESVRFVLLAEQAFGARDPVAIQQMPLERFDADSPPEPGQIISFHLPSGQEIPGHVLAVDSEQVEVDFNHPLAGRNIVLEVVVLDVIA